MLGGLSKSMKLDSWAGLYFADRQRSDNKPFFQCLPLWGPEDFHEPFSSKKPPPIG